MSESQQQTRSVSTKQEDASLGEVIDTVKAYAKQETIGPLKGAGTWLAYGAAGSFALGIGLMLILLGTLRLLQSEWETSASGGWSWVAYAIVLVVTIVLLVLTLLRIKKSTLNNEPK